MTRRLRTGRNAGSGQPGVVELSRRGDRSLAQLAAEPGAALVLVHGRGGDGRSMLPLRAELGASVALAPQAPGNSWYPNRFVAPRAANEPQLTAALEQLDAAVDELLGAGFDRSRIVVLGFSQGACLALEFVASRAAGLGGAGLDRAGLDAASPEAPERWGGVVGWSGGLIGATLRPPNGRLDGVPVFLGCSDRDPHIPLERVQASAAAFERAGAVVDTRIYPGMAHTVNADEIAAAMAIVRAAGAS